MTLKDWHRLQTPESERLLNTAPQELNNSSIGTKRIASKYSYKLLYQQNPLTIPVEGDQETKTGQETFSTS
jgi:hypothetical protein